MTGIYDDSAGNRARVHADGNDVQQRDLSFGYGHCYGPRSTIAAKSWDFTELSTSGPFSGYMRVGKTYTDVAAPNSTETRVRGLNNAGVLVGRFTDSSGVIRGFSAQ